MSEAGLGETWVAELRGPIHGRLQTIRGMCTDERPHVEIDAKLAEVDELVHVLSVAIELPPSKPSARILELARQRFGAEAASGACESRLVGVETVEPNNPTESGELAMNTEHVVEEPDETGCICPQDFVHPDCVAHRELLESGRAGSWKPSDQPSPMFVRAADRLFEAVERQIRGGRIAARSEIGDAALDYRKEWDEMAERAAVRRPSREMERERIRTALEGSDA